ncbi:Hypothetical predicted protein, partial [Paramuricea clavata]
MAKKVPFKVVHASGSDDGYSAKELEIHSPTTKGWRSSKFCVYPQEIILMLQESMRIRKLQILAHQYLIPTKIEIFIGSIPEGQSSSLLTCKFKRLGHVSLVDNQTTDYKSRELKSVHLDAHGQFVKLFIHKNHVNKYNLYNQVQIIATNVIAENIESFHEFNDSSSANKLVDQYMKQENLMPGDPLWGKINKPDYISPLDDIAFAMYQDPQTAEIIRELELRKKEAIKEDEFVEAKKFHQVINDLHKVGERLGRLNVEKQKAIEIEDYDLAMVKKQQIDEYRKVVTDRLVSAGIIEESHKEAPPMTDRNSNHAPPSTRSPQSPPLPPITRRAVPETQSPEVPAPTKSPNISPRPPEDKEQSPSSPRVSPVQKTAADERPLPTMAKKDTQEPVDQSPTENTTSPSQGGPSELKEKDAREAALAIDVFGEHVVRCVYTKQWKYRQEGMEVIKRELTSEKPESIAERDSRSVIRAVVDLLKKGINEQVHPVFVLCLSILKDLLTTYIPKQEAQSEIPFVLQKTIPLLLPKTGDMTSRIKNSAMEFIIEISEYEGVKKAPANFQYSIRIVKARKKPQRASLRQITLTSLQNRRALFDVEPSLTEIRKYNELINVTFPGLQSVTSRVLQSSRHFCCFAILSALKDIQATKLASPILTKFGMPFHCLVLEIFAKIDREYLEISSFQHRVDKTYRDATGRKMINCACSASLNNLPSMRTKKSLVFRPPSTVLLVTYKFSVLGFEPTNQFLGLDLFKFEKFFNIRKKFHICFVCHRHVYSSQFTCWTALPPLLAIACLLFCQEGRQCRVAFEIY